MLLPCVPEPVLLSCLLLCGCRAAELLEGAAVHALPALPRFALTAVLIYSIPAEAESVVLCWFGVRAGMSSKVVSMFVCKDVSGVLYLEADFTQQCGGAKW